MSFHIPEYNIIKMIVNLFQVLIDAPASAGIQRKIICTRRLTLTDIKLPLGRQQHRKYVEKAFADAKVEEQWAKTSIAKCIAKRETRAKLSDFDRFKIMVEKKKAHMKKN